MERQAGGRDRQAAGKLTGRHAVMARAHQQAKYRQSMLVGKRGKTFDGGFRFHASRIVEILSQDHARLAAVPRNELSKRSGSTQYFTCKT
jgi:hypothetical protein